MLSEEVIDKVVERIVQRYENANTAILKKIGETIKKIGTLKPSDALRLQSILKYGGSYEKIAKELSKLTGLTIQDIYKIFEQVSKENLEFAKEFYKYRNKDFIPYKDNFALQQQVESISRVTIDEFISNTSMLGYGMQDANGNIIYRGIRETYNRLIDEAIMSIASGKETFQESMYRQLKTLGSGGLKVIYPSTYVDKNGVVKHHVRRLDSVLRTSIKEGVRELHNANQEIIGEEIGSNMVEVSHHSNSAPDHIDTVDGKQFARIDVIKRQIKSGEEKEIKLSDIKGNKVKVKGKWYYDFDYINNNLVRHVSMLNCYHYTFEGILGISKPAFTEEELQKDKKTNLNGFEYEGKHYTMYEGTQLLRKIELELRKAKDEQILGKSSGIIQNIEDAQNKITQLTHKYRDVLKASGLSSKLERARVVNYHRVSTKKLK